MFNDKDLKLKEGLKLKVSCFELVGMVFKLRLSHFSPHTLPKSCVL
jgi:hypothetical protein